MKKLFLLLFAGVMCASASAQIFSKGDMVVDLGIGAGRADNLETKGKFPDYSYKKSSGATFTQKLAFEYGVAELGKSTIGLGVIVANAYGASYDGAASGKYDYKYNMDHYRYEKSNRGKYKWTRYQTTSERRKGKGVAKASYAVENVDFLVKGSFHHQFIDRLDTYGTFGVGLSVYKLLCSPDDDETLGFSADSNPFNSSKDHGYQMVYSYDDLDHTKWDGTSAKVRFAMALYVGARYYLTPSWAVNAEIGLTSASFKKDANNYNILSIGASYKF